MTITYYFIVLFFMMISIYCQQIDEIVECNSKDLHQYQLDTMSLHEQEQLVNKFFCFIRKKTDIEKFFNVIWDLLDRSKKKLLFAILRHIFNELIRLIIREYDHEKHVLSVEFNC